MKRVILRCLVAALRWAFGHLSAAATCRVGKVLGDIGRVLDGRHRKIARHNLLLAFGDTKSEDEIELIIKGVYRNIGQTAVEFFKIPSLTLESALEFVTPEHRDRLDECVEDGRGIVLLAAHFGNWEMMGTIAALAGYKISAVARPMDDPDLDEIVREIRESSGLTILTRRTSAFAIVRRLKRGEIVGVLADQNTRKQNVFVDFFGIKAATTPGPAQLALKTGAHLLPVFMVREDCGKQRFIIEEAIEPVRTGDDDADVVATTQKCVDILEKYVRKYPSQWFWVHRRWKTRPDGEPPIYL
jgi:KDO2-lipid IV(A) lauroyltransferase